MKRLLFLAALLFTLVTPPASGIVDTNNNGMSDLWELQFNDQELFLPGTFLPQDDPDGDGWNNGKEAAAGTNPFEPNPPDGYVRPAITYSTDVWLDLNSDGTPEFYPAVATIGWPVLPGKLYTLQVSPDLGAGNWLLVDQAPADAIAERICHIPLTQADGPPPDKLFWRVAISDTDTDGDGLSNCEEYLAGTDPAISDSDGDTLSDYAETVAGTNPNNCDEDGDGLTDAFEIAAGTDSKNQDNDGDAIPDSIDSQPLVSVQAFADADGDGIPDDVDPDVANPRGSKPLIVSNNAAGNPQCDVQLDKAVSFIITVSNPAGPMPGPSDFTFYLNGTAETANITALTESASANSTQRFRLSWNAKLATGYPAQTLQNLSLRFKDSQNATSWLNLARIDVAEWEGMIAGMQCSPLDDGYWDIGVVSHFRGVKQPVQSLVSERNSIYYRGPKTIPLLDASGANTGATSQIDAQRYPLFLISRSASGTYSVASPRDISDPAFYPHNGWFYNNRSTTTLTMSGDTDIPPGEIVFQPLPEAPESGFSNFQMIGTSVIDGEEETVYSAVWFLIKANRWFREFQGFQWNGAGLALSHQPSGLLWAGIGARIIPHTAGPQEQPGIPISPGQFPPAPYDNYASRASLLPIQPEQWHKLVLKVGPDAGALSDGICLKLGSGEDGDDAPQPGFTLQVENGSGVVTLAIPTDGKIEMSPTSELYQNLISPEGLTLFLKHNSAVHDAHCLTLELMPKEPSYESWRIAALDLIPVDLDVNGDGDLTDFYDGLNTYTPGYELDHEPNPAMLHTGDSFENVQFSGPQEMKLIIRGLGSGKVDSATFRIFNPSSDFGYCSNADSKDPGSVGVALNWGADFSFAGSTDLLEIEGTVEADKIWAPIFCKDYGAWCEVEITLKKNGAVIENPIRLTLPRDENSDKMADCWERGEVNRWNEQFHLNEGDEDWVDPDDMATWSPVFGTDDAELADSDGDDGPMPAMADKGDGLSARDEYRGYILDGGPGITTPNHRRLSAARKEQLVECSEMEGIASTTLRLPPDEFFTDQGNDPNTFAQGYSLNSTMSQVSAFFAMEGPATGSNPKYFPGAAIDTWWVKDKLNDDAGNVVYDNGNARSIYKYSGPYTDQQRTNNNERNGWLSIASDRVLYDQNEGAHKLLYGGGEGVAVLANYNNRNARCRDFIKLSLDGRKGFRANNGDFYTKVEEAAREQDERGEPDRPTYQGAAMFVNSLSEERGVSSQTVFTSLLEYAISHELAHLFIGNDDNHFSGNSNVLSVNGGTSLATSSFVQDEITNTKLRQRASINRDANGKPQP